MKKRKQPWNVSVETDQHDMPIGRMVDEPIEAAEELAGQFGIGSSSVDVEVEERFEQHVEYCIHHQSKRVPKRQQLHRKTWRTKGKIISN